jgi:hypothetical protein
MARASILTEWQVARAAPLATLGNKKKGGLFQRVEDLEDSVAEVVEGVEAVPKRNRKGRTAEEISPLSFTVWE